MRPHVPRKAKEARMRDATSFSIGKRHRAPAFMRMSTEASLNRMSKRHLRYVRLSDAEVIVQEIFPDCRPFVCSGTGNKLRLSAARKAAAGIGKEGLPWAFSECPCARNNRIISKLCQWSVFSRNRQPCFRFSDILSQSYSHIPGLLVG